MTTRNPARDRKEFWADKEANARHCATIDRPGKLEIAAGLPARRPLRSI